MLPVTKDFKKNKLKGELKLQLARVNLGVTKRNNFITLPNGSPSHTWSEIGHKLNTYCYYVSTRICVCSGIKVACGWSNHSTNYAYLEVCSDMLRIKGTCSNFFWMQITFLMREGKINDEWDETEALSCDLWQYTNYDNILWYYTLKQCYRLTKCDKLKHCDKLK